MLYHVVLLIWEMSEPEVWKPNAVELAVQYLRYRSGQGEYKDEDLTFRVIEKKIKRSTQAINYRKDGDKLEKRDVKKEKLPFGKLDGSRSASRANVYRITEQGKKKAKEELENKFVPVIFLLNDRGNKIPTMITEGEGIKLGFIRCTSFEKGDDEIGIYKIPSVKDPGKKFSSGYYAVKIELEPKDFDKLNQNDTKDDIYILKSNKPNEGRYFKFDITEKKEDDILFHKKISSKCPLKGCPFCGKNKFADLLIRDFKNCFIEDKKDREETKPSLPPKPSLDILDDIGDYLRSGLVTTIEGDSGKLEGYFKGEADISLDNIDQLDDTLLKIITERNEYGEAIEDGSNLLIIGGPASGKTTVTMMIANELSRKKGTWVYILDRDPKNLEKYRDELKKDLEILADKKKKQEEIDIWVVIEDVHLFNRADIGELYEHITKDVKVDIRFLINARKAKLENCVFTLESKFREYLVEGEVGKEIRDVFEKHDNPLLRETEVIQDKSNKWFIEDEKQRFRVVEDIDENLNVYLDHVSNKGEIKNIDAKEKKDDIFPVSKKLEKRRPRKVHRGFFRDMIRDSNKIDIENEDVSALRDSILKELPEENIISLIDNEKLKYLAKTDLVVLREIYKIVDRQKDEKKVDWSSVRKHIIDREIDNASITDKKTARSMLNLLGYLQKFEIEGICDIFHTAIESNNIEDILDKFEKTRFLVVEEEDHHLYYSFKHPQVGTLIHQALSQEQEASSLDDDVNELINELLSSSLELSSFKRNNFVVIWGLLALSELSEVCVTDKSLELMMDYTGDKSSDVRGWCVYGIGCYAGQGMVKEKILIKLLDLLQDDDPQVREDTVWTIGKYAVQGQTNEKALPKLIKLLHDEIPEIRRWTANSVGKYAEQRETKEEALTPLIELLNDGDPKVREEAVWAIGNYAEQGKTREEALNKLIKLLNDKNAEVRRWTANSIWKYAEQGETKEEALTPLIELLHDGDTEVRRWTAYAIGKYAVQGKIKEEALPHLVELLHDGNPKVREDTVWAIGKYAEQGETNEEALPVLVELLKDKNTEVRRWTAFAVGNYALQGKTKEEALMALIELLNDGDPKVREDTVWAIGNYAEQGETNEEALPVLVELLQDENTEVRRWTAFAVGNYALQGKTKEEALPVLVELLNDENPEVRRWTAYAIGNYALQGKTKEEALMALIELLNDGDPKVREDTVWAIGNYAEQGKIEKEALPVLVELLHDKEPEVRKWTAYAIGNYATQGETNEEALTALVELLHDGNTEVRMGTAYAIGNYANRGKQTKKH